MMLSTVVKALCIALFLALTELLEMPSPRHATLHNGAQMPTLGLG